QSCRVYDFMKSETYIIFSYDFEENASKRTATTTPTTPMSEAANRAALIAQGVADALLERDADKSRNGDDSHDSGNGMRRQVFVARKCTYTEFLKCQPLNF
ncbi:hypothetical protein Tco_0075743, partial [Tanacetum coccineum]